MAKETYRYRIALEDNFEGRLSSKQQDLDPAATAKVKTSTNEAVTPAFNTTTDATTSPGGTDLDPMGVSGPRDALRGLATAGAPAIATPEPTPTATPEPDFDGLLVSWEPWSTAEERSQARQALGLQLRETIRTAAMQRSGAGPLELVDLPAGLLPAQAIAALSRRPGVAFAEKNWKLTTQATSNDPYMTSNQLWGMGGGYGSNAAAAAWATDKLGSRGVYVGIIDEGYQYDHLDLIANAGVNPGEIAGNGIDDDGNGYADDVYGWNFDRNNNQINTSQDDHGTHVAGTIGASGGNGIGVAGVNWNISLLNAKFLGNRGGTTANAIKAVDYFTDLKTRHGLNIVATNNSWGGGSFSQGLQDAINRAGAANILFIAAAGNDGRNNDTTTSYPSGYSGANVIAVASITSSGALSSFSNYGATSVDLGAPGSDIMSTLPGGSYGSYSGTSMATPHVTGTAGLLASIFPWATALQIKDALLAGSTATPSLNGKTATGGRLDIQGAINVLAQLNGGGGTPSLLPSVSLMATDASASETNQDPCSFTLTRNNINLAGSLTVQLIWRGSASNGQDYAPQPTSVTFSPNETSLTLSITPFDDSDYEGGETIILEIQSNPSLYAISGSSSATVNLTDNDINPNPTTIDPITNFTGNFDTFISTRQMFLDGNLNPSFGHASYASTASTQAFDPNVNRVRLLDRDANGNPLSWFFSSKYSLNGVTGLAVFADLGPSTNLASGRPGAEDDLVAFINGWSYRGQTFLGSASSANWIQVVPVA